MLPRPVPCMNTCAGLCGSWRVAARIPATSRGGIKGTHPPPKINRGGRHRVSLSFACLGVPRGWQLGRLPSPPLPHSRKELEGTPLPTAVPQAKN